MKYLAVILALCWTIIFLVAGIMADNDEQKAFDYYCEMVKDGNWPDYKNSLGNCNVK